MVWYFLKRLFGGLSPDDLIGLEEYIEKNEPLAYDQIVGGQLPPKKAGIYAWYFGWTPPFVSAAECFSKSGWTLLYIGQASKNLRTRIMNCHFRGSADNSTLRLTLGCLLQEALPVKLSRTWRGRWTFGRRGERLLSEWMRLHARVAWVLLHDQAVDWPAMKGEKDAQVLDRAEKRLIKSFRLPLNLRHNTAETCGAVKRIREQRMKIAKG